MTNDNGSGRNGKRINAGAPTVTLMYDSMDLSYFDGLTDLGKKNLQELYNLKTPVDRLSRQAKAELLFRIHCMRQGGSADDMNMGIKQGKLDENVLKLNICVKQGELDENVLKPTPLEMIRYVIESYPDPTMPEVTYLEFVADAIEKIILPLEAQDEYGIGSAIEVLVTFGTDKKTCDTLNITGAKLETVKGAVEDTLIQVMETGTEEMREKAKEGLEIIAIRAEKEEGENRLGKKLERVARRYESGNAIRRSVLDILKRMDGADQGRIKKPSRPPPPPRTDKRRTLRA